MPRTIDEGFRDFLGRLTPTGTESRGAQSHRASIEACLRSNFGLRRFTRIGSFGNGTSVSGYSDVDYLACLPTSALTANSAYSLGKVRDALDARFPNSGVRVDSPAIVVPFGSVAAEYTEVVPADQVSDSGSFAVYDIADGVGGWLRASPDAHNWYVRSNDERLGGKLKPLIRFLKAWKYLRDVPIGSFYLELRTTKYAASESSIAYYIDLRNVLKLLCDAELSAMQDPMSVSGYIAGCSTSAKRDEAYSKLTTAFTRADKALDAATAGNVSDAFYWWGLLFADQFPSYYY